MANVDIQRRMSRGSIRRGRSISPVLETNVAVGTTFNQWWGRRSVRGMATQMRGPPPSRAHRWPCWSALDEPQGPKRSSPVPLNTRRAARRMRRNRLPAWARGSSSLGGAAVSDGAASSRKCGPVSAMPCIAARASHGADWKTTLRSPHASSRSASAGAKFRQLLSWRDSRGDPARAIGRQAA